MAQHQQISVHIKFRHFKKLKLLLKELKAIIGLMVF